MDKNVLFLSTSEHTKIDNNGCSCLTFLQTKFRQSKLLDLIPYATDIIKLKGKCKYCDKSAHYTKLFNYETSRGQIIVGGVDIYTAVCVEHYFNE